MEEIQVMDEKDQAQRASQPVSTKLDSRALGLDVGTSRIVLADGYSDSKTHSQLNAFVAVPYSKMTASILQQNKMTHYRNGKDLYVYGSDSERFASVSNVAPRRPMQHGVLNSQEEMGQQIIRAIIE